MHTPSAYELVHLWEWGEASHPADRAVGMLVLAGVAPSQAEGAALDLDTRDRALLDVRRFWFGDALHLTAACPSCAAVMEFDATVEELRTTPPDLVRIEVQIGDTRVEVRKATTDDVVAVGAADDLEAARRALVARCVVGAWRGEHRVESSMLPEEALDGAAEALREAMPQADIRFALRCADCETAWKVAFDVARYLWTEIDVEARRLLGETRVLARRYGWSEREILTMSAARRALYLGEGES